MSSQAELDQVQPGMVGDERARTRRDRLTDLAARSWLFFFLLGLLGYFWLSTPSGTFLTWGNLEQIALNTSEVILLAIGETFVIVTAGIDLSIGGILFFSAVAGGEVMIHLAGRVSRRSTANTRTRASRSPWESPSASSRGRRGG